MGEPPRPAAGSRAAEREGADGGGPRRDPRLTIARRELASLRSEKTIVLALLIQLFVAAFSSFLVVGLVSLYDPGTGEGFTVETAVAGDDAEDLLAAVGEVDAMDGRLYPSTEAAADAFAERRVDAALLVTETPGDRYEVRVLVPEGNVGTTVVVTQARQALRAFERAERGEREAHLASRTLELPPRTDASPYFGFTYTVLVPLLLFLPVFIAGSVTVDSLTEELDRGTFELLRVAPVTPTDVVEGKLLAAAGLAPVQAALWLGLLAWNGTAVAPAASAFGTAVGVAALLALVAAAAAVVAAMGAALAFVAPDRRAAQTVYSLAVLGLFGAAALSPVNPANVAARLAVGTADAISFLAVAGMVTLGVAALAGARVAVGRHSFD